MTTTAEQIALCILNPIGCFNEAGRRIETGAAKLAERGAGETAASVREIGEESTSMLDRLERSVDSFADSAQRPLQEVSSIAMWTAIGFLAIAAIIVAIVLVYLLSPVIAAARAIAPA